MNKQFHWLSFLVLVSFVSASSVSDAQENNPDSGVISGLVFQDENENGVKDDGETGGAAVVVEVLNEDGEFIERVVTGEDGLYSFEGLEDGIYFLRFEFSAGFAVRSVGITVGDGGSVVFTPVPFIYPNSRYDFVRLNLSNPASFRGNEVSSFAP